MSKLTETKYDLCPFKMRPQDLLKFLMNQGVKVEGTVYTIPSSYEFEIIETTPDLVSPKYSGTNLIPLTGDPFLFDIAWAVSTQGRVLYIDTLDNGQYQTPVKLAASMERMRNWGRPLIYSTPEPDMVCFKGIPIVSNFALEFLPPRTVDYLALLGPLKVLAQQHYKYAVLNKASEYDIVIAGKAAPYLTSTIENRTGLVRSYIYST